MKAMEETHKATDSTSDVALTSASPDDSSDLASPESSQENPLIPKCEVKKVPEPERWEIAPREGPHETLCDFDAGAVTFEIYGNIANFLLVATPQMLLTSEEQSEFSIPLPKIWKFYDDVNGFEVPICTADGELAFSLYYTPLLSSINIRIAESGELITYSTDAAPLERMPLAQQVEHLIQRAVSNLELLSTLKTVEVDPESYYSVLWAPIHCQSHSPQKSAGGFLTYHSIHPSKLNSSFPVANQPYSMVPESNIEVSPNEKLINDEAGMRPESAYYCNCIGFIPYRAQSAIWYCETGKRTYSAPLQLIRNAYTLVHLKTVTETADHDMGYYLKNDREMTQFLTPGNLE